MSSLLAAAIGGSAVVAAVLKYEPALLAALREIEARGLALLQEHAPSLVPYGFWTALAAAFLVAGTIKVAVTALSKKPVPLVLSDLDATIAGGKVSSTALTRPDRPGFIQCYSPSTLTFLGEVKIDTADDVRAAVARGRALQAAWAKTSWAERRRVLAIIKRAILAQADAIVRLSCIDTGKPRVDAQFGEILSSCGKLDWVMAEGQAILSREARPTNFTSMHKKAFVEYAPLGVLGVIAPWNYPFYNLYNHIASGLFAGNALVLKISEYSAWSGAAFIQVARDALVAAGHPADLVQLVQGFGETGAALVAATDKLIFTGSPGVGKAVMGGASKTLTPLVLELGGKDPFIICEDADVDAALVLTLRGTFQNAGQNCVGIERVYVHEGVYDQFVAKAEAAVARLRVGPPITLPAAAAAGPCRSSEVAYTDTDVGCITTAPQLGLIKGLVDDAVAKGAKLHCGGRILFTGPLDAPAPAPAPAAAAGAGAAAPAAAAEKPATKASRGGRGRSTSPGPRARGAAAGAGAAPEAPAAASAGGATGPAAEAAAALYAPGTAGGLFFAPTLLSGVTHDMRIANEEVFGPVMAIFKVPRNDDDAAVAMANSTAYGLGATVYSSSPARANAIAGKLKCGMVGVNAFGLNYLVQSLPFGGVGASGFDRFSGPEGLRACCHVKSVVTDLMGAVSIPTPVPKLLQYPVDAAAPAFTDNLIAMQFAPSLWQKVLGMVGLSGLPVSIKY